MHDTASEIERQLRGRTIGQYRVVRKIGEGGMALVFEAHHQRLGPASRAAIKVLSPEMTDSPEMSARFFNEARAASLISHPGIVKIIDFGHLEDGLAFLVMEHLDGGSLSARFDAMGQRPHPSLLRLARQVALAMAEVHRLGIVHRDLKPSNVMLVRDELISGGDRVKIVDFGIAKLRPEHYHPDNTVLQTRLGSFLGTPIFMSPEQCAGVTDLDGQSDVYSLGVMLYWFVSGRVPFDGPYEDVLSMHLRARPDLLSKVAPSVPRSVAALIHRMLDKLADWRPAMDEVAAALGEAEEGLPQETPPPAPRRAAGLHARTTVLGEAATPRAGAEQGPARGWLRRIFRGGRRRP